MQRDEAPGQGLGRFGSSTQEHPNGSNAAQTYPFGGGLGEPLDRVENRHSV
jgi:hypothetical protein